MEKAVVKSGIGRIELDAVDQFATPGCRQRGGWQLPPPTLGQEQVLDIGGVVDFQLRGACQGRHDLCRAVKPRQLEQPPQVKRSFHGPLPEFQMELARRGAQGVELLFQRSRAGANLIRA